MAQTKVLKRFKKYSERRVRGKAHLRCIVCLKKSPFCSRGFSVKRLLSKNEVVCKECAGE